MVLVPVRLGLRSLHPRYCPALVALLELPQSLGFLGGSPNHAIYFVGHAGGDAATRAGAATAAARSSGGGATGGGGGCDGKKTAESTAAARTVLLGLDPHTTQPSPPRHKRRDGRCGLCGGDCGAGGCEDHSGRASAAALQGRGGLGVGSGSGQSRGREKEEDEAEEDEAADVAGLWPLQDDEFFR